jgi:hypothetical protein
VVANEQEVEARGSHPPKIAGVGSLSRDSACNKNQRWTSPPKREETIKFDPSNIPGDDGRGQWRESEPPTLSRGR